MDTKTYINIANGALTPRVFTYPKAIDGELTTRLVDKFDYIFSSSPNKKVYINSIINCDNIDDVQKSIELILANTNIFASLEDITDKFKMIELGESESNSTVTIYDTKLDTLTLTQEPHFESKDCYLLIKFTAALHNAPPASNNYRKLISQTRMKDILPLVYEKIKLTNEIKSDLNNLALKQKI